MEYNITFGALISSPVVVDLATAKANSNIDSSDQDALLNILLEASIDDAENHTGASIRKRSVTVEFDQWAKVYDIPHHPVQSITSVSYFDLDGVEQTLDAADYKLYNTNSGPRLQIGLTSLPALDPDTYFPVKVVMVAGFDNDKMPAYVKSAVLLRFSHKEYFREDSAIPTSLDRTFQSALRPLKRY